MYGHVPEAFEPVSLNDRSTWHNATLREWLDLRSHLLAKQAGQGDAGDWDDKKMKVMFEVASRLAKEMDIYSESPRPPKGGDVDKRRAELMDELFYKKYPEYDPLTEWETEFLEATKWLDEVLDAYKSTRDRSALGLLFSWVIGVEDCENLAERRKQRRARYRDAVATVSERRLKSRKNPFYPRPVELVHIARAAQLVIENIKRNYEVFFAYGGPVPGTETEDAFRLREFMRTSSWSQRIISFIDELRRIGYVPCRDEQECLGWPMWRSHFDKPAWATARAFLAFLFDVSPATIRKDLSEARLQRLYDGIKIHRSLRVFHRKSGHPKAVTLLPPGWSERLTDGRPNRHDLGTTYYRLPRY